MCEKPVYLGTRELDSFIAGRVLKCQHWAVKVGEEWIEVEGTCKGDSESPMKVNFNQGSKSGSGIENQKVFRLIEPLLVLTFRGTLLTNSDVRLVGNTRKTIEVIIFFVSQILI